jgi:hypothetical protein
LFFPLEEFHRFLMIPHSVQCGFILPQISCQKKCAPGIPPVFPVLLISKSLQILRPYFTGCPADLLWKHILPANSPAGKKQNDIKTDDPASEEHPFLIHQYEETCLFRPDRTASALFSPAACRVVKGKQCPAEQ